MIGDVIVNALLFVGIGVGAREGILGPWAIPMGVAAGVCIALITWVVAQIQEQDDDVFNSVGGFDPDDALYLIGPIAWFGGLTPLLVAAVIGAPAFALWALWRYRYLRACAMHGRTHAAPRTKD